MIKNIVFDMGNVLIRFDPELFMSRYSLSEEEKILLRRAVFHSAEWVMLDRGVLDESTVEKNILPRLPIPLRKIACELIEQWDEPLIPIKGMMELLTSLKQQGYRLYLLSNAAARQHDYWSKAAVSILMDGTMISADVKLLKPDPRIYQIFLRKFNLSPEECVFVDDTPVNVEGALYENMAGIVFHGDVDALKKDLRALGVDI